MQQSFISKLFGIICHKNQLTGTLLSPGATNRIHECQQQTQ